MTHSSGLLSFLARKRGCRFGDALRPSLRRVLSSSLNALRSHADPEFPVPRQRLHGLGEPGNVSGRYDETVNAVIDEVIHTASRAAHNDG